MARESSKGHDPSTGGARAKNAEERMAEETVRELQQMLKNDPLAAFRGTLTENELLRSLASANHQKFLITLLFLAVALGAAWAGWKREVEFRYFYINSEGHVYETHGFNYPTANTARVMNFARDIATQMHTWTYRNHADVFTGLMDKCDPAVIRQYHNALGENGVFTTAERYSQRYESVVTAGRVEREAVIDSTGRKGWEVSLTLNEEIIGTTRPVAREYDIMIRVYQVPLSVSPTGLRCVHYDENYRVRTP